MSTKITIIGLGLVGNSMGLALKQGAGEASDLKIVGFDPVRGREMAALRKHRSVDEIAPDLDSAVRGATLVILSTPQNAAREVLAAIGSLLDSGTTVTDTLPVKTQVMAWAGELLGPNVSFVGGHPLSKLADLDTQFDSEEPRPDLFKGAPYCIMPLRGAGNEALNRVINVAELVGAKPLFIDPQEHDSYMAAATQLPTLIAAALLRLTTSSASWSDITALAGSAFASVTEPISVPPEALLESLLANRHWLGGWLDRYIESLLQMKDDLAAGDASSLFTELTKLSAAREQWRRGDSSEDSHERGLQADLSQSVDEARFSRTLMGNYVMDRFLKKREKDKAE